MELVVRGNRFFTIGDDGAEFFNYRKGDVIFNAAQTEEIFRKGKLSGSDTRAHAYLEGNAFVRGSGTIGGLAYGGSSEKKKKKKKKKKQKKSKSYTSNKSRSSSRSSSGGSKRRRSGGSSKRRSSGGGSSKSKTKNDPKYYDWIEVLISRIERKITRLKKVSDSTFRTTAERNKSLQKGMTITTKEITKQEKAYNHYMKSANKVKKPKNVKASVWNSLKKKVRNGAIDLDSIKNESLQKQLARYQELYEKGLAASDAILDLRERRSQYAKERFENIATSRRNSIDHISSIEGIRQTNADAAAARGTSNTKKGINAATKYYKLMRANETKILEKETKRRKAMSDELKQSVNAGYIKEYSQAWWDLKKQIDESSSSIAEAKKKIAEYDKTIREIRWDRTTARYQNPIERLGVFQSTVQTYADTATAQGHVNNTRYYTAMRSHEINIRNREIAKRKALNKELNDFVNSGKIKPYTQEWYDYRKQIDECTASIADSNKKIADFSASIRQIQWDKIDFAHSQVTRVADEGSFLAGLVDENDLYDKKGNLTKKGLMVQGLHAQSYDVYTRDAKAYGLQIDKIEEQLKKDPTNKILIDRRNDLIDAQQKSIEAANSEKKALQDLAKQGVSKLLDSMKELIDKYKESLDDAKSLYDYQKKMKEKTEEISMLEKQLSAYAGDTSEEGRKNIQKLKKDLASAREELQDTQYDRYISNTKELLDDVYEKYEKFLNDKVENVTSVLKDSIQQTNANAKTINATIKSVAKSVGYDISTAMAKTWNTGKSKSGNVVNTTGTGKIKSAGALREEKEKANNVYDSPGQAKAKGKAVKKVNSQAGQSKGKPKKKKSKVVKKKATAKTGTKKKGTTKNKGAAKGKKVTKKKGVTKSALAKKYSFFIPKKYTGKKTQAHLWKAGKTGIRSRLAYYDIDYSNKALAKYYNSMGLNRKKNKKGKYIYGKKYKGSHAQNLAMINWIKKKGFKKGVEDLAYDQLAWTQERAPETIIRRSDNAILTQLKRGDSVLNRQATSNIWDMANHPAKFIMDNMALPSFPAKAAGDTVNNSIDLEIVLPNVSNYKEFMNAARTDPKFEKLVQAMTTDRLAKKSAQVKNSIKW